MLGGCLHAALYQGDCGTNYHLCSYWDLCCHDGTHLAFQNQLCEKPGRRTCCWLSLSVVPHAVLCFRRGGFSVNHMDIAPKYAGVVMGISNTAGEALTEMGGGG